MGPGSSILVMLGKTIAIDPANATANTLTISITHDALRALLLEALSLRRVANSFSIFSLLLLADSVLVSLAA